MIDKSHLVPIVQSAFLPLECVAELQNYDHAFGFAVTMPSGPRIVFKERNVASLQDAQKLTSVILGVRRKIESKGLRLDPWSLVLPI